MEAGRLGLKAESNNGKDEFPSSSARFSILHPCGFLPARWPHDVSFEIEPGQLVALVDRVAR
jgi:hypothetical protein